jgi:wobble nucleotide-excising tRNase
LNKLLKSYLGHHKITLAPTEQGYQICRDEKPSNKPLSEGEKTAVAFCYFVTALTAEGRKIEDVIVVIDDPVSSLDTRAMSHVVGMIRLRFSKCTQFFVLTHNLDFMREMKKWLNKKRLDGEASFLFVETRIYDDQTRSSKIVEMPALIREYESEYHYLFSLACMLVGDPGKAGGFLYLMPNAMRKVLETFLAFKQPGYADLQGLEKILELHPEIDAERVKAMEVLVQAESHSQNIGDSVSFSAYTLEQITDATQTLLALIEVADKPHYDRMRKLCKA